MKKVLFVVLVLAAGFCFFSCERHPAHGAEELVIPEKREEKVIHEKHEILFMPDEFNFLDEYKALKTIENVANEFNSYKAEAKDDETFTIQIIGYAAIIDNGMDPNWLSYERAKKVSDILLNTHGLRSNISIFAPFKYEGVPLIPFYEPEPINIVEEKPYEWRGETDEFSKTDLEPNRVVVIEIVNTKVEVTPSSKIPVPLCPWNIPMIVIFAIGAVLLIVGLILQNPILGIIGYVLMLASSLAIYFICKIITLLIILSAVTAVGIIILVLMFVSFGGGGGSGGGSSRGSSGGGGRNKKEPEDITISKNNDENQHSESQNPINKNYKGGYYGEINKISGKTTPHHIPSNGALNKAFGFTGINEDGEKEGKINGWTPAVEMDYEDHEYTTSYGNSTEGNIYQQKEVNLMQAGKMAEALKMGVDDVLRIQGMRGLGNKYNKALQEAVRYMLLLHTLSDEELFNILPDFAKHPVLVKSRANPENKNILEKMLEELA